MRIVRPRPACGVLTVLLVLGPAATAWGHASSVIPHARLSAQGPQVVLEWTAAGDDVVDIGVGLGLLPEEASLAFRGIGDGFPTDDELAAFARSEQLHDYLLDNVEVSQDGQPCDPELTVTDAVVAEGVRFDFTCPEPVEVVDVRITLLHDRDPAYRTYSIDGTIWDAIHTVDHPEHRWDATLVPTGDRRGHLPWLLAGLAAVGAAIAGVLRWWQPGRLRRGGRS